MFIEIGKLSGFLASGLERLALTLLSLVFCYGVQSRDFSFHSCRIPRSRISKNRNAGSMAVCFVVSKMIRGRGINRAISTSKIRKITASKKNRSEKGVRAVWFGSKPHSYGLDFSRFFTIRMDVKMVITISAIGIAKDMRTLVVRSFIPQKHQVAFASLKDWC